MHLCGSACGYTGHGSENGPNSSAPANTSLLAVDQDLYDFAEQIIARRFRMYPGAPIKLPHVAKNKELIGADGVLVKGYRVAKELRLRWAGEKGGSRHFRASLDRCRTEGRTFASRLFHP
jgi:hypothetical protein